MTPHGRYVLRIADSNLVLAQRLGEWVGHAPALEEDLGLANVSLGLLGQARLLLAHAGQLEGRGRGEDELAFLREESEYFNLTLVDEQTGAARTFGREVSYYFGRDSDGAWSEGAPWDRAWLPAVQPQPPPASIAPAPSPASGAEGPASSGSTTSVACS